MDFILKRDNTDKELIYKFEKSDVNISYFCAILDTIIIIISSFNLKSKISNIEKLNIKISKIVIIDIIIRIAYTRKYLNKIFLIEILLNVLNTCLFYLILFFFDYILNNNKNKDYEKRIQFSVIFFFITLSYEKIYFIKFDKLIIIIQSFIIIFFIYYFYKDIKEKFNNIATYIINETEQKYKIIFLIILGSPYIIFNFLFSYYFLRIFFLFIKDPRFFIYTNIVLIIIKDSSKYFVFFICKAIIYLISKKEKEIRRKKEKNYIFMTKKLIKVINI